MIGKVSVTLVTVIGPLFGLLTVTVNVDTPPDAMVTGANAFAMVGAVALTVKLAVFDIGPVAASLLDTPVVVLGNVPGVLLFTMIETVQLPLAGIVKPIKLISPV